MEISTIENNAFEYFVSGYHCAEVVVKSISDVFLNDLKPEVLKAASAFGGGIAGTTEDLCGAFTGGVMAAGLLLGRENPGLEMTDCGKVIKEFKSRFIENFGSTNCRTILESNNNKDTRMDCVRLTSKSSAILAELLSDYENNLGINIAAIDFQSRKMVELGQCPFSGCNSEGCECEAL